MEPDQAPTFQLPQFDQVTLVGQGGFGAVYRGQHKALSIPVAIKVFSHSLQSPRERERFCDEARLMARIDHPNVLRVYELGERSGQIYIVSEWMDGGCLSGPLADRQAWLSVAVSCCEALRTLSDRGIIHRDVKPANILWRKSDGRIKLADLGIAIDLNATADHELTGTLPYMAPELLSDELPQYGPATDLYAMGISLYELWCGKRPHGGKSMSELMKAISNDEAPAIGTHRGGLGADAEALLHHLIEKDPAARLSDYATLAQRLASLRDHPDAAPARDGKAPDTSPGPPQQPTESTGPWVLGEPLYQSNNWRQFLVRHFQTQRPGRLVTLQPSSKLDHELILDSVSKVSSTRCDALIQVLDWGEAEDLPYVVLEPLGRSLTELIKQAGPLQELAALSLGLNIAQSLTSLHEHGLVYQVVEPGAIFPDSTLRSLKLGWPMFCQGIGQPSEGKRVLVSGAAAPEAYDNEPFDPATDVFGIAVTLYYAMTGSFPFTDFYQSVTKGLPPLREANPQVTAPTAALLTHLAASAPADRPTAAEAAALLSESVSRLAGG